MSEGEGGLWRPARFKGERVFAQSREDGTLVTDGRGMVAFCYKPGGRTYGSRPESFAVEAGASAERFERGEPAPARGGTAPRPGRSAASVTGRGGIVEESKRRGAERAVQLWTDGACSGNPGPAGLGVRYEYGSEIREVSEYLGESTNNIAELTAILRGLELVQDPRTPVDVMTDSSYCLGLLGLGWKPKANQALVAELRAVYARFEDVLLVKVKGHAGVAGNERADELAREAIVRRGTWRS